MISEVPSSVFDRGLCWVSGWLGAGGLDVPTAKGEGPQRDEQSQPQPVLHQCQWMSEPAGSSRNRVNIGNLEPQNLARLVFKRASEMRTFQVERQPGLH